MQKPRVPMASLYLAIVFIWCICGVCSASFSATDGPNIGYAIAYHRSEDEAGLPDKGNFFTGPPTRRILQSGDCSDNDNSDFAVFQCSNAVRQNPDLFAGDYPCDYNSWRHEVVGKNPMYLNMHGTLENIARLHADDEARNNRMSHFGSDGSTLQIRADRQNLPWKSLGENVAEGFHSAKQVVMAWMCSAGHRKNLMSCDFNLIGIGIADSTSGRTFYAQNFACILGTDCACGGGQSQAVAVATASGPGASASSSSSSSSGSSSSSSSSAVSSAGFGPEQQPSQGFEFQGGDESRIREAIQMGSAWQWNCGFQGNVWTCNRVLVNG